ncbi:MAG: glycoside hydrolase family 15 protein [Acidimicrobiales bacterium]
MRDDPGYADIGDYAVIGDGRSAALVACDGRIDWWALPSLDSPPIFAALVDPKTGGYFSLRPRGEISTTRRYADATNVLETTFTTLSGTLVVTHAMATGTAGRLPWSEIGCRAQCVSGTVEVVYELVPGTRFGTASPWMKVAGSTPIAQVADQSLALVTDCPPAEVGTHELSGSFTLHGGERRVLGILATDGEPLFIATPQAVDARIDKTAQDWRRWSALLDNDGRWASAVERSALALKTVIAEDTGAIAAAATTSLPEKIGGHKNWDYRFAWVRDSSFVLDALMSLGLHEEAHRAMSWLLRAIRCNGGDLAIFYTLGAQLPTECKELDAPGYRGSRPVREGNDAAGQVQLGNYGDLFDAVRHYVAAGHVLDTATSTMLSELADECCDQWREVDSGIWELDSRQHYTISKIGCWVALERAIALARDGQIQGGHRQRWRAESEEIRRFVETECWSGSKGAYTFYAGTDRLDASVLLAGRTDFDRGKRLSSTADAVLAELGAPPAVWRYSGAQNEEGAFVACTFWLIEALAYVGRGAEAAVLMDSAISALPNDVGIMAEQFDPATGQSLGNLPQALSHLALIIAAYTLRSVHEHEGELGAS